MVKKKEVKLRLESWVKVISISDNNFGSNMAKELNITYSHISSVLIRLNKLNWVSSEKQGRKRIYYLTQKGKEIKKSCDFLIDKLLEQEI